MAKAIADPEELRRFAASLRKFNTQLAGSLQSLQGQMVALGSTWRDQEFEKFSAEFDETTRAMQRFQQASEQQIPFLLRKAERIEEYLRQR